MSVPQGNKTAFYLQISADTGEQVSDSVPGDRPEKVVFGTGGVRVDLGRKSALLCGIIDIVFGIEWMGCPVLTVIIKCLPHFDLHDDISFMGPFEHRRKTVPILRIPLIQIVFPIGQLLERGTSQPPSFRPLMVLRI